MEDNYLGVGFNKFLTRKRETPERTEFLEDEVSLLIKQLSGGLIAFGETNAPDSKMVIDWTNRKITIKDGVRDRVIVGYIKEENKYGVRVIDGSGVTQLDETY